MALTVGTCKHPDLIVHELYHDHYAFYVAPDLVPTEVSEAWLARQSLLYMPDAKDDEGKALSNYVHGWDCGFREHFELDALEVVSEFTRKGLGIGILPTHVARLHREQLTAIQLPCVPARFGKHCFFLSWRNDLDLNHKIVMRILRLAHNASESL